MESQNVRPEELTWRVGISAIRSVEDLPQGDEWIPGVASRYKFVLKAPEQRRDVEAERKRLEGDLRKAAVERDKFAAKLDSPSFVERAPAEVVEKNRRLLQEFDHKVAELEAALGRL